ncbi:hypothetical protein H4J58_15765 [Colwellia sp. MB3u-70]|uniref:hypothetical protein n=1 Tax=unclassified Colwellia TaxID=196834 RepID=UPI0015F6651D|nr:MULTISPECIES: hypothetical protein [unclassified Colwellia]MBA6291924.1 hypothetical protein [Colwellia sp. MB3u-8]MBA6308568.1 hypothetical protein [Colwellia sp. MB3u-70]
MRLKVFTLAMVLTMPVMASEEFSLTDMIPARPGTEVANAEQVKVSGDIVLADDSTLAVAVAHQALIDDNEDGIKMIQVGSGTGILSIGSTSYNTYDNVNATLLSKRGAYNQAYLIAKKQLIENMKGVEHQCANVVDARLDVIDTGVEGVANEQTSMLEACKESVSGSLAGFVTYDVFDNTDEKGVRVSLISTPKTRSQIKGNRGAVAITTEPNIIFQQVISDVKTGVLPPVGAKVLTNINTDEVIVMGYGSAIIRQNKNKSLSRKLKSAAKSQSQTRARSALLATMQGEKVYWEGSFDENQMEGTQQFEYDDPNLNDPQQVKILEEDRSTFLNQLKMSDQYATLAKGKLPPGVSVKSFESDDGFWQYSVAVYAPSLEATARQAAKEMTGNNGQTANGVAREGRKIKAHGGLNDQATNPKGVSGKVTTEEEL